MTDDLKARLLPCPFCGGKPEHTAIRDGRQVFCGGCHAGGPPAYRAPAGRPSALSRAITGWNNRPATDRIAELEAEFDKAEKDALHCHRACNDWMRRAARLRNVLTLVWFACVYDDDGNRVEPKTRPTISEELFSEICAALQETPDD